MCLNIENLILDKSTKLVIFLYYFELYWKNEIKTEIKKDHFSVVFLFPSERGRSRTPNL